MKKAQKLLYSLAFVAICGLCILSFPFFALPPFVLNVHLIGKVITIFGIILTGIGIIGEKRLTNWEEEIRGTKFLSKADEFSSNIYINSLDRFRLTGRISYLVITVLFLGYIVWGKNPIYSTIFTISLVIFCLINFIAFIFIGFIQMVIYGFVFPVFWMMMLPYRLITYLKIKFELESTLEVFGIIFQVIGLILA